MKKYLDELSRADQEKVFAAILDIEAQGLDGTTVSLRQIEGKLWEIRVSQ